MKVGASVVIARRGGCSATFDALNKFFTISGMPVVSSQYWDSVHDGGPGDAKEDAEGIQTVRVLARNMTFLMKSIALGKEKFGLPGKKKITFGQISSDGLLNYTAAKNRLFKIEFYFPQFFSSQGHS